MPPKPLDHQPVHLGGLFLVRKMPRARQLHHLDAAREQRVVVPDGRVAAVCVRVFVCVCG
jgi:hypothetical protein